jgi:large subunit ribosomal protein L21
MYAVIKAGGKQHKVKAGDVIEIELVHGTEQGEVISFTPILVVDDDGKTHFGKDLGKAVVKGKLVGEEKGDKVKIFKYRPKTGYAKRQGHRQMYTLVEIEDVALTKRAAPKKAPGKAEKAEPTAEAPAEAEAGAAGEGSPQAEGASEPQGQASTEPEGQAEPEAEEVAEPQGQASTEPE